MSTIIGLVVVIGSVLGGFAMASGPFGVLVQPNELVVIGGAALGALVISAPGKVMSRVKHSFGLGFKIDVPNKSDFMDLLKLLYQIFSVMRRDGVLALEGHVNSPDQSAIFKNYPSVTRRHHAMVFLLDALKQLVDGCTPEELAMLLDADIETMHEEEHQPIGLIRTTSDALPGLGIVAAVLGIIITMGHLDAGPEVIGHHVGAALVGTFLGILLCYGVLSPIATSVEMQVGANGKYIQCIKDGVLAAARGAAPAIAVEFSRRSIFNDERPSFQELDQAIQALKSSGGG
ncbi:MAG TPA: flagellar motor stator protein MotA [Polyangiales bacterium]|nr:flagellar motor stator protein MotA [Polyangiales bacterium]